MNFKWLKSSKPARVTWQYTMLPLLPNSDQTTVNPVEYLELMNSLGESGYELVTVFNNIAIFKKQCYAQVK
jgi:hypothetical protein